MNSHFNHIICHATGATSFFVIEEIQSLWSGYGSIVRLGLKDSIHKTIVVKHVRLGDTDNHPRGWNTDLSHQRKVRSYKVESEWYLKWSSRCDSDIVVPRCLAVEPFENEVLIVLEDLNETEFCETRKDANQVEIEACLTWLANFHARFMGETPVHLWNQGTYWHLETRPEELAELQDLQLKKVASFIDDKLRSGKFKTIVHGDAKLANFCFTKEGERVAAVDFQYVGGGCGMKDVVYFLGSCLAEKQCEKHVPVYLDFYFKKLIGRLKDTAFPVDEIEEEWRALFPFAWADFHRFIKGWSPSHWKINDYSEKITRQVIESLL